MPDEEHYRHRWMTEVVAGHQTGMEAEKAASGFAKIVIQAGLLLNGGALAAIPVLLEKAELAKTAPLFSLASLFVCGLLLSVIAAGIGYFNFSFIAGSRWAYAKASAAQITRLATNGMEIRDQAGPERRGKRYWKAARLLAGVGIATMIVAYVCFGIGIFGLIGLIQPAA